MTDITLYLVDDQELFRAGLAMVLNSQQDFQIVGQSGDAHQALGEIAALHPSVVLMDIRMPGMDGIAATAAIVAAARERAETPPHILMLTTLDTEEAAHRSLTAGAAGFMLKDTEPEFLIAAVRTLAAGKRVIATANALPLDPIPAPRRAPAAFGRLTEREHEVFAQVAHGLNNREIAATLHLSEATVKTHLTAILQKLQLRDRVQVVVYAYEHGLANEPTPESQTFG
ncbi:MAG: response regulator transcription factor [Microbacteriaceae bacterium]|jgi:DNA-binding NarL/FixJ family response regulator|nr:response regulator transcription factor [Microbacteriaceae bacterium]